jgi:hypothetical protein
MIGNACQVMYESKRVVQVQCNESRFCKHQ